MIKISKDGTNRRSTAYIFSNKLFCGDCGTKYGSKVWHSNSKYKRTIWQCNDKFNNKKKCKTPHLYEEEIKEKFVEAVNILVGNKKEIISTYKELLRELYNIDELNIEKEKLEDEMNIIADLINKCLQENAKVVQDQDVYQKKYDSLVDRYNETKEKFDKVKDEIIHKETTEFVINEFLEKLKTQELITEFDSELWFDLVDKIIVNKDKKLKFVFQNGSEIEV